MAEPTRRRFLQATGGLLALYGTPLLAALRMATPAQPTGPFYPEATPLDDDNDLTQVAGQAQRAQGRITELGGRLLDRNGRPLQDLRIEIWQCDANGRYHHPRDRRDQPLDPGFQGSGHTRTDAQGRYRFRTIHPVPYPGRTPHIHVAVFPPDEEPFITQLYVAGEPRNSEDFLYRRVPAEQRSLVTTAFTPAGPGAAGLVAEWDIVLGITPA